MKAVMLSIKPKYCELIASGKKTIEVRKTRPKIETPFKCYIYETKTVYVSKNKENEFLKPIQDKHFGKVIAEFVCDGIDRIVHGGTSNENISLCIFLDNWQNAPLPNEYLYQTQLTYNELEKYSNGRDLYGWHISDLVIYDKPKELSEFNKIGALNYDEWLYGIYNGRDENSYEKYLLPFKITRPPQAWCYVEKA